MAFGSKLKGLIKKKTGGKSVGGDDATPSSSPVPSTDGIKPVISTDATEKKKTNVATNAAPGASPSPGAPSIMTENRDDVPTTDTTEADEVLDGILQDLNIKVGQLAVNAGEKGDDVSEYSGGSAKSIETSESSEGGEEEESSDEEDSDDEEEEKKAKKKKKSTVGDRVAAVVAAAEEIRKKRGGTPPVEQQQPVVVEETVVVDDVPVAESKEGEASKSSNKSPKKNKLKELAKRASGRKSPAKNMVPLKKGRSTSPKFSPEVGDNVAESETFDTKEDPVVPGRERLCLSEDERSAYDDEDGTLGEGTLGEGTLGENTLGTDGVSYEDETSASYDEDGGVKRTKKTVMNKDIIIHQPGGPSGLVVRAMYYTPLPASPEDIIIKVEASTVSFRDCLLRRGIGPDKIAFPFIPGCEVVGTISNVGSMARKEGYRVGDRVVGMSRTGGGNGYYAKLHSRNVSPIISANIDAADAACLVDVYMTAYQALRVGKKDGTPLTEANVLVTDGFSPVGQAVVQLAKLEGANVYVTTTETRQDEYMKSLGVKCLPLSPNKWLHKLKGKMDIVIDNTCFDSYDSSWKALNANGVLVCTSAMNSIYNFNRDAGGSACGACDAFGDTRDYQSKWAAFKARYMMSQTKFLDLWESFQNQPKKYQQELKYLCFLVESGMLKPKIAERVNIEEIPDAQRYLETGKANGTIVCLP